MKGHALVNKLLLPYSSADHTSIHTREVQIKLCWNYQTVLDLTLNSTHRLYPIRYCALPLLLAVKMALGFLQKKTTSRSGDIFAFISQGVRAKY